MLQELETVLVVAMEELVAPEEESHPNDLPRSVSNLICYDNSFDETHSRAR